MPRLQMKGVCQSMHQSIVWWIASTFSCPTKLASGALIKTWKAKKSVRWVFTWRQGANLLNGVSVSIPPNITACQIGCQFHVMSWRRFRWRMVESAPLSFQIIMLHCISALCRWISCIMHRIVLFRLSGNYIPLYQPTLSGITLLEMAMVMVWWYGRKMIG